MFLENENKYFDEQNKENYPHQHLTFQKERFLLPPTNINLLLTSASPVNIFHPMPISQSNSSFVFATPFPHKRKQKGASLIGDTPFIIEKSMILHFSRDPSHKFSLQNNRPLIAHLFIL